MTFPDEPLELVECTKKCMTVSDRMSEPPSYVHCRYKSASGVELFSYCAVLDDRSAITSLYAYLRALIAAHIRRLQEKIGSGKMALVPLEKHAIQQFFTEKRASSLSFLRCFLGCAFLATRPIWLLERTYMHTSVARIHSYTKKRIHTGMTVSC